MKPKDRTNVSTESIANVLRETIGEVELEKLSRECGLLKRKREVTPFALLMACLSTLGVSEARWLADIHRSFNKQNGKQVQYKPFHKQLAKLAFPRFLQLVVQRGSREFRVADSHKLAR